MQSHSKYPLPNGCFDRQSSLPSSPSQSQRRSVTPSSCKSSQMRFNFINQRKFHPNLNTYRPRALSASVTLRRGFVENPVVVCHNSNNRRHSFVRQSSVPSSAGTTAPCVADSVPCNYHLRNGFNNSTNSNRMAMFSCNDHTTMNGTSNGYFSSSDTSADFRLGRYFDSMNSNYRSVSYNQTAVPKPSLLKASSNQNDIEQADDRLKPIPRLPEANDNGLPVIRPKRSDSVRSTDSRTTTASTASTLVPTTKSSTPFSSVNPSLPSSAPPSSQPAPPPALEVASSISSTLTQSEDCRSSIRSNTSTATPTPSNSLKKGPNNGTNGPVRRVRFADEPPAEYSLEPDDNSRATPSDGAIVVVTKRLGPSLCLSSTPSQPPTPASTSQSSTGYSATLLSTNRVPPPYPHHRLSAPVPTSAAPAPSTTAEVDNASVSAANHPSSGVWRRGASLPPNSVPELLDDGYDSVNQTPSEGSVNSTASSSGLPQSTSPDHQQLDSSVDSLQPHHQQTLLQSLTLPYTAGSNNVHQRMSYSNSNYTSSPLVSNNNNSAYAAVPSSNLYGSLVFNKQRPVSYSTSSHRPSMYQSAPAYQVPPAQQMTSTLPPSYSRHSSYSSTLNMPQSVSSASQYRWLPGRAPSSSLGSHFPSASTLSLQNGFGPSPSSMANPYATNARPLQHQNGPLVRAPSFRQLSGPEPVCVVAEHEFGSLLDSLPIGVIGHLNHP